MSKTVDDERKQLAAEEGWRRIDEALRRLQIISRMKRDGRSYDEMAKVLGVHRTTVIRLVVAAKVIARKCQRSPNP